MLNSADIARRAAQTLSDAGREILFGEIMTNTVLALAEKYSLKGFLPINTLARTAAEAGIGAIPKNRLRQELQERLGVPEGTALDMADTIQREILSALTPKITANSAPSTPQTPPVSSVANEPAAPSRATSPYAKPATLEDLLPHQTNVPPDARPRIPLPEDILLRPKQSQAPPRPPATPANISQGSPRAPQTAGPISAPLRRPIPERAADARRDDASPQLDGNIVDLRQ